MFSLRAKEIRNKLFVLAKGSGLLVFALFFYVILSLGVYGKIFDNKNNFAPASGASNYTIQGKIKDIKRNTIFLEALTLNSINSPLGPKETETRKLESGNKTSVMRLNFIPAKEGVKIPANPTSKDLLSASKFRGETQKADLADLKIGDNVSINYSLSQSWIRGKRFVISTVTILPYSTIE